MIQITQKPSHTELTIVAQQKPAYASGILLFSYAFPLYRGLIFIGGIALLLLAKPIAEGREWTFPAALLALTLAAACQPRQPVCPPATGEPDFLTAPPAELPAPAPAAPAQVEINGKMVQVDKVVSGPLCNDTWRGTVYVTCDVQVYPWEDEQQPLFLEGCNLVIEPGTVVYVADHNDTVYYNGCSCHTGEAGGP